MKMYLYVHGFDHVGSAEMQWRWVLLRRVSQARAVELALSTGRMHLSHVGTNKICFLLSLAFCALLVLLIPSLQPPQRQADLPQPRPRAKPARAGRRHDLYGNPGQGSHDAKDGSFIHPLPPRGRPWDTQTMLEGDAAHGNSPGSLSKDSLDLRDIFIAVKTTRKYHKSRLQLLSQTWVSKAKEQVGKRCCISLLLINNHYYSGIPKLHIQFILICFGNFSLCQGSSPRFSLQMQSKCKYEHLTFWKRQILYPYRDISNQKYSIYFSI